MVVIRVRFSLDFEVYIVFYLVVFEGVNYFRNWIVLVLVGERSGKFFNGFGLYFLKVRGF